MPANALALQPVLRKKVEIIPQYKLSLPVTARPEFRSPVIASTVRHHQLLLLQCNEWKATRLTKQDNMFPEEMHPAAMKRACHVTNQRFENNVWKRYRAIPTAIDAPYANNNIYVKKDCR